MLKIRRILALVLSVCMLTPVFEFTAFAYYYDGPSGSPEYRLYNTKTSGWFEEYHDYYPKALGDSYYSVRFKYNIEISTSAYDEIAYKVALKPMTVAYNNQAFHVDSSHCEALSFTFENDYAVSLSHTLGQKVSDTVESSFTIPDIGGFSQKCENEFSNSFTQQLQNTYSSAFSNEITFGVAVDATYYSTSSSGCFGGLYTIRSDKYRIVLVEIEYREYKSKKSGCSYEWVPQDPIKKYTSKVVDTFFLPQKDALQKERVGIRFGFYSTQTAFFDDLDHKNQ